jgi:hypothetical protein
MRGYADLAEAAEPTTRCGLPYSIAFPTLNPSLLLTTKPSCHS